MTIAENEIGLLESIANGGLHEGLYGSGFLESSQDIELLSAVQEYGTPLRDVVLEEAGRAALRKSLSRLVQEAIADGIYAPDSAIIGKILSEFP